MKRRGLKICIISILVISFIGAAFTFYYNFAKNEKTRLKAYVDYYNSVVQNEQKWLASLQQSNGALAFRGKENGTVSIVPYFSSITAIALLQKSSGPEYEDVVKRYFDWYFAHLNDGVSDKNGVSGTIYNYSAEVVNGIVQQEKTDGKYDSTDSYSALFLTALWEYYKQSGDSEYLIAHYKQINDVIGAMKATIDEDGLSYAKPDYKVKYLMDNSEVFMGTSCCINLLEQVFLPYYDKSTAEYNSIKMTIVYLKQTADIQGQDFSTILWNKAGQHYEIGLDNRGKALNFTGWSKFYPDAVAQLYPILAGVINPDGEQAHYLYNSFGEHFKWHNMDYYENGDTDFYWGITAYIGALMHDENRVRSYIDCYLAKVTPDYEYPAYNADVAWVVLASAEMAKFYQEQMYNIDPLGIVAEY